MVYFSHSDSEDDIFTLPEEVRNNNCTDRDKLLLMSFSGKPIDRHITSGMVFLKMSDQTCSVLYMFGHTSKIQ